MGAADDLALFEKPPAAMPGGLRARFGEPPFSTLDTRQGTWQDRKRAWLSLGIQSEVGRKDSLIFEHWTAKDAQFYDKKTAIERDLGRKMTTQEFIDQHYVPPEGGAFESGTSIFDPVLCELAYRWFAPPGGTVLDPFAGGSVRGIVASALGLTYTGVDLREEQVIANFEQYHRLGPVVDPEERAIPTWVTGDSRVAVPNMPERSFDFMFTCPPYYDLEVYSDDPADLSRAPSWGDFCDAYVQILADSAYRLKDERFAAVVISNIRDKRGHYLNLVGETIDAFAAAGLVLYNEAVVLNMVGTAAMRSSRAFTANRKLARCHQSFLVFLKSDTGAPPSWAREAILEG